MTVENRLRNDPVTFTITTDDPFGFGNIFGKGNIFGEYKQPDVNVTYDATIAPVTEPYPASSYSESYTTGVGLGGATLSADCLTEGVTYSFTGTTHFYDPIQGMIARIEQLEKEVAMFKAAGQALKQINEELRAHTDEPMENPQTAYERAMKVVK